MISLFKKFGYYSSWFFKCGILKQTIPLNSSIILTDKCNLTCKHCVVANLGYQDLTFAQACQNIDTLFDTGSRMLVITGGEPFCWKDKTFGIEDIVQYAKRKGFFRVVICTNGTYALKSSADYLWVSLDGFPGEHNDIRGDIYERVVSNIKNSRHKKIYINFTISTINQSNFDVSAEEILKIKEIKGILFHLYTPYLGADKTLTLEKDERVKAIKKLWEIKKKHPVRISNTFSGISALKKDNWQRPLWGSVTINQGRLTTCCCREGIYNENVCQNCGCTPAVETWVLQTLSPSAMIENLRFL